MANRWDVTVNQDHGVIKEVIKCGLNPGSPRSGDEVTIQYKGKVVDGPEFLEKTVLTFNLNNDKIVEGLVVGISTMKQGEICTFTCQPNYGYGEKGLPPHVPPNATLLFEVELVNWKGEDLSAAKDGGIFRRIIVDGEDSSMPNYGATLNVHIKGMHGGRTFEDRDVTFDLGYGLEQGVVSGIERALKKFKKGETSLLTLSPKYAFGLSGSKDLSIPGDITVQYKVQLKEYTKAKEQWELNPSEKISKAERQKGHGTFLLQKGNIRSALTSYSRAIGTLDDSPDYTAQEVTSKNTLLLSLHLNCALCCIKLEQWTDAINKCDQVLAFDSTNEKALFRKAQASMGKKDYEEAITNFREVTLHYPSNKSALNGINNAKKLAQQDQSKAKEKYQGMFERFAELDAQKEMLNKARGLLTDDPIGYWSNDMADGMMSLHQELEAFGEKMPEKGRKSSSSGDR